MERSLSCALDSPRLHAARYYASTYRFVFHVRVRYMLSLVRLSVVCNVRVPYSGGSNFRQYFYGIRCIGHPLKISRISSQGNPSAGGVKHKRGSQDAKYSDFEPIDGYISETVQDRR